MTHLTTHVLDAATGPPAENVVVSLARHPSPAAAPSDIAHGFTDADGRLALGPERLEPGNVRPDFPHRRLVRRPAASRPSIPSSPSPSPSNRGRRHEPALARAAAAQPVRLFDLPRELDMSDVSVSLGANKYGKAENRVVRIYRDTPRHEIVDLNVTSQLRGAALVDSYLTGDNALVVATDTQKNTAFAFAKEHGIRSPEEYLLTLARPLRERVRLDRGRALAGRAVRVGAHPGRRPAARSLVRAQGPGHAARGGAGDRRRDARDGRREGPDGAQVDRQRVRRASRATGTRPSSRPTTASWRPRSPDAGASSPRRSRPASTTTASTPRCRPCCCRPSRPCTRSPCSRRCSRWARPRSRPAPRSPRCASRCRTSTTSSTTSPRSGSRTRARSSTPPTARTG